MRLPPQVCACGNLKTMWSHGLNFSCTTSWLFSSTLSSVTHGIEPHILSLQFVIVWISFLGFTHCVFQFSSTLVSGSQFFFVFFVFNISVSHATRLDFFPCTFVFHTFDLISSSHAPCQESLGGSHVSATFVFHFDVSSECFLVCDLRILFSARPLISSTAAWISHHVPCGVFPSLAVFVGYLTLKLPWESLSGTSLPHSSTHKKKKNKWHETNGSMKTHISFYYTTNTSHLCKSVFQGAPPVSCIFQTQSKVKT